MLCCYENTAEEINIVMTVFPTVFSMISSAQNTHFIFTIRMMYQANSFRHASRATSPDGGGLETPAASLLVPLKVGIAAVGVDALGDPSESEGKPRLQGERSRSFSESPFKKETKNGAPSVFPNMSVAEANRKEKEFVYTKR